MADEPKEPPQIEAVPSRQGDTSAIASANAPFLYFDGARNYGFRDGIACITLEALRHNSVGDAVITDRVVVAHLRMSYAGFQTLKGAVNGIELMVAPPPESKKN